MSRRTVLMWTVIAIPAAFAGPEAVACDGVSARVGSGSAANVECLKPGDAFRDSDAGPEMIVVGGGRFAMGSSASEVAELSGLLGREAFGNETPVHDVVIADAFAVGRYEVTRREFADFVEAAGHAAGDACWLLTSDGFSEASGKSWRDPGYPADDTHPASCVNWDDAKAYVAWLSQATGHAYRLLSESEWEFVARAGATGRYAWGGEAMRDAANYGTDACCGPATGGADQWDFAAPVGRFAANAWGLHDLAGNVTEWVEDCHSSDYVDAPADGSPLPDTGCLSRMVRGGSWADGPLGIRPANRTKLPSELRGNTLGFRVARTL